MRTAFIALALALASSACATPPAQPSAETADQSTVDEQAIRALQQAQADAWNAHDIRAYATLFAEDAHVVNVLGWHWRSRAELEQKLGRGFAWAFAGSALTIEDVEVRFVGADAAAAHVRWTLAGARSPTGAVTDIPRQDVQTQVLRKQQDRWLIAFFQNTNAQPERDMPLGPQR